MRLPKLAIANPQFTLILTVLLVLLGVVAYMNMPRSEDPQFDLPITSIEIIYPGVSSSDIESLVVEPLESKIAEIENIKKLETQVKADGARIEVEFKYGVDPDVSYNKIKQAVDSAKSEMPSGVTNILVLKATPRDVAITQLALWSVPTDYKRMEIYAKRLKKHLETIAGVQRASIWGYPSQIVSVDVNLAALQQYNLSIAEINQALSQRVQNITVGFVDTNTRRFTIHASGSITSLAQIKKIVIKSGESFTLRLADVAQVYFGKIPPNYLAYYQHHPVIFITAEQSKNTNIFALTKQIDQQVATFKRSLPSDMQLTTLFKQADSVKHRVDGFFKNLWQGLAVVGVMSLLFLGFKEALVVMLAIPLSFLIAIGWLDISGFGLQQMSIVGLIIALGLLVDNAIVVTESINREKHQYKNMREAAAKATSKVGWAITSGTVTTMFAFLPMLMLKSSTGDFLRSMPVTVMLVLLASLLVALTLTPLLASRFMHLKTPPSRLKFKTLQEVSNRFAERVYVRGLVVLMKSKWLVLTVSVVILLAMMSLFTQVGVSLFPKAEKPMLLVDVETVPNSSLAYTDQVLQKAASFVRRQPLVKTVAINVGSANPRIYYNEIPKRGMAQYGQLLVLLDHYQADSVMSLVNQLRTEFNRWPEAKITVKEFTQGPVTDQPIAIRFISDSLDDLEQVSNDLAKKLVAMPGVVNINNPIGLLSSELNLNIDYQRAGLLNIDIATLDATLKTIYGGMPVGKLVASDGEDYPIVVRKIKPSMADLSQIMVKNRVGALIPITSVISPKLTKDHADFFHYQKLRMSKVSADVKTNYSVSDLTQQVLSYLKHYKLPNGVSYIVGGEEENRQKSFGGLSQILIITAIGIFAILVLQFKSFMQPLIIFTAIPFAMAGSAIGLYLAGLSFSMMAFIGLISLFGIVVNNAIILIDTTNQNIHAGQSKSQAILNASNTRFTPILLTTLTTIGGLVPLTLFGGNLWQPLGVVIISGLCVSAIASLLLVPLLTELLTKQRVVNIEP